MIADILNERVMSACGDDQEDVAQTFRDLMTF